MKISKIIAVATLAVAAGQAMATEACSSGSARSVQLFGGSGVPVASPVFIRTGFNVMCSSSVILHYSEVSGTLFTVAAGSAKGNQSVKGSSNGGSITVYSKCSGTNDACTAGDVTTALAAASS